jgi:hypothetical protein
MNTKSLQSRIDTLVRTVPIGCKTCRTWTDMAIIDDDGDRSQPSRCPDCGRQVTVTTWVHIVGVPLDAI